MRNTAYNCYFIQSSDLSRSPECLHALYLLLERGEDLSAQAGQGDVDVGVDSEADQDRQPGGGQEAQAQAAQDTDQPEERYSRLIFMPFSLYNMYIQRHFISDIRPDKQRYVEMLELLKDIRLEISHNVSQRVFT